MPEFSRAATTVCSLFSLFLKSLYLTLNLIQSLLDWSKPGEVKVNLICCVLVEKIESNPTHSTGSVRCIFNNQRCDNHANFRAFDVSDLLGPRDPCKWAALQILRVLWAEEKMLG
ncbi:MAG: hypothetical protein DMF68_09960 [Acidobacteria bacterium]|nr:MAG: hypothetical protein DMF68_09960 [Acidobacteriota bacterium]